MSSDLMKAIENRSWGRFPSGTLPCGSCGVPVSVMDAAHIEEIELAGRDMQGEFSLDGQFRTHTLIVDMPVTRCQVCAQIQQSARDLMAANSAVRGAIGDPGIAVHRLELALDALDILGVTDHRVIDELTATGPAIMRLIDAFAEVGGVARWSSGAARARWPRAMHLPPSESRWSHVSVDQHRDLNQAQVMFHVARTEVPVPILAPSEDGRPTGCMLCGVASVDELPSRAAYVWVEMSADPNTIGGPDAPEMIDGVLCPTCDAAVDDAGGIGPSAMSRSVTRTLGIRPFGYIPIEIDGLVGWGVLPGARPNSEPWQHVDLSAIREQVRGSV